MLGQTKLVFVNYFQKDKKSIGVIRGKIFGVMANNILF